MGTIDTVEPVFCYIIVKRSLVRDGTSYKLCLPDWSTMKILATYFSGGGLFPRFYVYHSKLIYDITKATTVEFGRDTIMFDEFQLCDFTTGLNLNVT